MDGEYKINSHISCLLLLLIINMKFLRDKISTALARDNIRKNETHEYNKIFQSAKLRIEFLMIISLIMMSLG